MMMISRLRAALYLAGVALALVVRLVGCGRGSSSEQAEGTPAAAEHKAEGAEAEHHEDAGVVELSPEAMKRADIRVESVGTVHRRRSWSRRRNCSQTQTASLV